MKVGKREAAVSLVEHGDTLTSISERCGVSIEVLLKLNPQITNPDRIYVGEVLTLFILDQGLTPLYFR